MVVPLQYFVPLFILIIIISLVSAGIYFIAFKNSSVRRRNSGNKDFDKGKQFSDSKNTESYPVPPPPHDHEHMQNERLRARFELDSAYRDLRRGELIVQQIETYLQIGRASCRERV